MRLGATELQALPGHLGDGPPGQPLTLYLRPEDVLARPIAPGDANVFEALIQRIEFLGSYCLVTVAGPALAEQQLEVVLSLNFLSEQQLQTGSSLRLRLPPERLKVFA